tara:strand:+ start:39011 stop:40744 length:1734 start_codon:yes stop_codon:yes gene_type:complete
VNSTIAEKKLQGTGGGDLKPLLGLTLLMIVVHAAVGFSIPWGTEVVCNDDWAYSWACQQWFEQGTLRLHPSAMAWGLPQIILANGACLISGNDSGELLRWVGWGIGIVCVYVFYISLRLFGDCPWQAAGKATLLAVNPLVVPLTWSFMTDMMFLLLILAAVAIIELTGRTSNPLMPILAGIAIGLVTLQRQYGLALLLVFLARPIVWQPKRIWATLVGGLIPFLFLAFVWRWLDQGGGNTSGLGPRIVLIFQTLWDAPLESAANFCSAWLQGLALISLFWLPFELMSARRWQPRILVGCALAFLLSEMKLIFSNPAEFGFAALDRITWAHFYHVGLIGEGLHDTAILHLMRPGAPDIEGAIVLIHIVSLISGTLMLSRIIAALREAFRNGVRGFPALIPVPLTAFLLLLSAVVTISVLSKFFLFDRYLLICVALAGFMYHGKIHRKRLMLVFYVVFTLMLAAVSVAGTIDYWRWSDARFKLIDQLIANGVDPVDIDGGYGYHGLKTPVRITEDGKVDTEWETYWAGTRRPYYIEFNFGGRGSREISRMPFESPLYQPKDSMLHLNVPTYLPPQGGGR